MGRVIVLVLVLAVLVFLAVLFFKWIDRRVAQMRQKHLAQYAPWALRHEVPAPLAEHIIEQGRALEGAEDLLRSLLDDEATLLTTEDADRISHVLRQIVENKTRR